MIDPPGMCQNTVRETTAFFNDHDKAPESRTSAADTMMEEEYVLVLDGENTNFGENVYNNDDDDDDDDDSWGLMDQADQEAIEYEEEVFSEQSSSTSTSSGDEGEEYYDQWHGVAERDDGEAYGDSRANSPALWRGDLPSNGHSFIITPEPRPTTIEVVVTEDTEDWDDDEDDDDPYDSARLPLDRLSLLMRRSDKSRRCLQERSLPTKFYGSSRFFTIAIDRQKLRRMMDDP